LEQKLIALRAPWQNLVAERLIGSLRRECLDHVVLLNEKHLRGILTDFLGYYHCHRPDRFARNRARLNCPTRAKSSNSRSWADCIIVTLGKPPKVLSPAVRPKRWSGATPLSVDL